MAQYAAGGKRTAQARLAGAVTGEPIPRIAGIEPMIGIRRIDDHAQVRVALTTG